MFSNSTTNDQTQQNKRYAAVVEATYQFNGHDWLLCKLVREWNNKVREVAYLKDYDSTLPQRVEKIQNTILTDFAAT